MRALDLRPKTIVDSFSDFVRMHERSLRRALIAACGGDAGREATADALAYGWEHWDRVRSMENPVGYLYKVGRNKARRRMSRRAPVFAGETVVGIPDIEPGLPAALDRLSERQRVVVVLVHSYQWTLAEVAELLGLSKSSVQNHLERGMVHLRGVLGGVD